MLDRASCGHFCGYRRALTHSTLRWRDMESVIRLLLSRLNLFVYYPADECIRTYFPPGMSYKATRRLGNYCCICVARIFGNRHYLSAGGTFAKYRRYTKSKSSQTIRGKFKRQYRLRSSLTWRVFSPRINFLRAWIYKFLGEAKEYSTFRQLSIIL